MASLIAIPFLIGSVPIGLAVVGANHILKQKRMTNKFLYWGGITASAFGGWVVSNRLMTRYVESQVLSAENPDMVSPRMPTRLIVAIDTSASTVMDYKGRFETYQYPLTTDKHLYPLAKKYETMAKNMVKILQPDDVVFLDWNGQGVRYYDETKQSYNGTGSYKSIAEFIKGEGLDGGDYLTTTVTITDAPMASFREFRAESKFKEPYMKGDKIDMKRGNDGRFRRRLVIPLKKNAEHTQPYHGRDGLDFGRDNKGRFRRRLVIPKEDTEYEKGMLTKKIVPTPSNPSRTITDLFDDSIAYTPSPDEAFTEIEDITPPFTSPQYFYRWVGSRNSGNPIYFGYPDAPSYDNTLIHYVHPLYDEDYVRLIVEKLNSRL